MKKYFLVFVAGVISVFLFGLSLVRQEEKSVRQSPEFGKFAAVSKDMAADAVLKILGTPSCVQSQTQLERNEGPLCVPYANQAPAGLVLVYLQSDFIGRVYFNAAGKVARFEAFAPPRTKVENR